MELRHYLAAVRDGKKIVVVVFLLAVVLGAAVAFTQNSKYTSTTKLFVATQVESKDPAELLQRNAIAQQRISSYVEVLKGNVFASEVAAKTGSEFDVDVSVAPSTSVIDITVVAADAGTAKDVASAYADVAPGMLRELERSDTGGWQVVATVINEAEKGELTATRPPAVILVLAALLGLAAGVIGAVSWWAVRRELSADDRISTS